MSRGDVSVWILYIAPVEDWLTQDKISPREKKDGRMYAVTLNTRRCPETTRNREMDVAVVLLPASACYVRPLMGVEISHQKTKLTSCVYLDQVIVHSQVCYTPTKRASTKGIVNAGLSHEYTALRVVNTKQKATCFVSVTPYQEKRF